MIVLLMFLDNSGMLLCPNCNSELDPKKHKFCYGCAKPVPEIVSSLGTKQGKDFVQYDY